MDFSNINIGELGRQIFCHLLKATASDGTFDDIFHECQSSNTPFTDETFPPNQ